ncbi:MAG: class I SAM-dependent methyltransferase [Chloroflexota bacterium]
MIPITEDCPNCGQSNISVFYEVSKVPTNSVLLLSTQEEALNFPTGSIRLGVCHYCGFIYNIDFDLSLTEYSAKYEATQGYSPTFNKFHKKLAQDLIDKFELHQKEIIEIGCDKGDFITMLCEMGNNKGTGFDPAYVPGRHPSEIADQLTFIADFYGEKFASHTADFICCKMTLEHIPDTGDFVQTVRNSVGDKASIIFFQIPNANYVLDDLAFWDVYYEHCSYFTAGSLSHLFEQSGFKSVSTWTDYDDQYLMIEALPRQQNGVIPTPEGVEETVQKAAHFETAVHNLRQVWQVRINDFRKNGRKFVLWGGGSKGVAFLTTLGLTLDDIQYVVDINPIKSGTFMAATGQEIVGPDFLKTYQPDVIIIMNPIYTEEITNDLHNMGLSPEILTRTSQKTGAVMGLLTEAIVIEK